VHYFVIIDLFFEIVVVVINFVGLLRMDLDDDDVEIEEENHQ